MNKDIYLIGEAYKNQILEASKKMPANNAPAGKFQVGDVVIIKDYDIEGTVTSLNNDDKAYPMVQIKITNTPSYQQEDMPIGSTIFYPADGVEKITPSTVTNKQGMEDEAKFDAAHPGSPWGRF